MTDTPTVAAGILYLNAGRVLLLLRGPDSGSFPNTWGFPAGHIEEGESPHLAALRESQEEVGFAPASAAPLYEIDGFSLFLARDGFVPILNEESTGYAWAPVDALPQPLHPGVPEAVALAVSLCITPATGMDEREIDANGWFEVKDNPISKAGIFEYRGAQIPGAEDPEKLYSVLRPAEELSDPETIESFQLVPWIDDHAMLGEGPGLTLPEKKGIGGVIGQEVYFEGDTLYGNIKAFTKQLADKVDKGKRDLSCGYRCVYEWVPGVWNGRPYDVVQRKIRGNHVALVKKGRMGPDVAVLDHSDADRFVFTCDSTFEVNMTKTVNSGADEAAETEEEKKVSEEEKGSAKDADETSASEKKDDEEKESAAKDAKDEKAKDEDEKSKKDEAKDDDDEDMAAMDEAEITRRVSVRIAARDRLANRLSKHIGTFDSSAMDETDVAHYGVKKLGIKGVQKGHEVTAVDVYLNAVKAPAERSATPATGMDSAATTGNWLNKQRASYGR